MNRKGKNGKKWEATRAAFIADNPPNHQGYYTCYLCRRWIPYNEITIDHVVARSRAPSLRFVFSNLAFACSSCNEAKGSKAIVKQQEVSTEKDELEGLW